MKFLHVLNKNRLVLICFIIFAASIAYKKYSTSLEKAGVPAPTSVATVQEPLLSFPYLQEEVTYENKTDKIVLSGTLSYPNGEGPFPVAFLVQGYGPHTRDEEVSGHKIFFVIADYLTKQGLAVLRIDKRGIGKSTGNFEIATSKDFASDVESGIDFLKNHPKVDPLRIGLIGHSEGGLIAPIAASHKEGLAFIVMLAAPGVKGDELLMEQGKLILKTDGANDETISKDQLMREKLFNIVKVENNPEETEKKLLEVISKETSDPDKINLLTSHIKLMNSEWFRYFISYDPAEVLKEIKIPVLALNGDLDVQVSSKQNLPVVAKALEEAGNKQVKVVELPQINHLFQTCKTGSMQEYEDIEETMSPDVLSLVSNWILETTRR